MPTPPPKKTLSHLSCHPSLSFLSLFFWKKARKTTKKTRIFYPYRTPKIPGKEGKNVQKNKEILAGEKNKEFEKNKERKDRALSLCRNEICLQKRIALHRGVAATLTPIALHCATKLQRAPPENAKIEKHFKDDLVALS